MPFLSTENSHNGHREDETTALSDRQINRGYGNHSDENDDSNFDAYDDFDGYENLDEQVDQKNAICSVVDVIPLLDSKAEELHNIFIEDKVKNSTANKIVKWFNRSYPNETPIPSVYQVDTLYRKDAPYAPYTVDCCQNTCYAFQNTDESVCPECGSERYDASGKTKRSIRCLPIGPQLASLFINPSFLAQINEPNASIRQTFKGEILQRLVNEKELFSSKYDIGLALFVDGFQTHKRGGVKLNVVMLHRY
ncbi:hypothetical protein [Parasitella parasitica]|uniref:Uncharacterized protein n=1 Tax=Parasitella parasitica TaxID=35722 RepID=A0A0B7NN26_9FUNG|nr:hypothetical protein [Parasitella parasitica]